MNNVISVLENYIKFIGSTGFTLWIYYYINWRKAEQKFSLKVIMESTGLSKKTVVEYNKILRDYELIKLRKKTEGGKYSYRIKTLQPKKTGVKITNASSYINKTNKIPSKSDNTSISNKEEEVQTPKEKSLCSFRDVMKEKLLSFPRYNNRVYKNRSWRLTEKESANVERLMNTFTEKGILKYMEWWYRVKSRKFNGFSFGCLAIPDIIEEYLIKIKKVNLTKKADRKAAMERIEHDKLKLLIECLEKIDFKKPSEEDIDIIEEGISYGLVKKEKNKYIFVKEKINV